MAQCSDPGRGPVYDVIVAQIFYVHHGLPDLHMDLCKFNFGTDEPQYSSSQIKIVGPECNPFVWMRPPFTLVSTIRRQGRCVPSKNNNCAKTVPFLLDPITVVHLQFNGKSNDLPSDFTFNSHFDS
jgi:hypothetical protein